MPTYLDANGNPISAPQQKVYLDGNGEPIKLDAPAPEGFFHSLASGLGIPTSMSELKNASDSINPLKHPFKALAGPAAPVVEGAYNYGKRAVHDASDALESIRSGNPAQAGVDAMDAIPIAGPAVEKMADNAPVSAPGTSYFGQVKDALTPGNLGTALAASAQIAPMVLGAADTALPKRPLVAPLNISENLKSAGGRMIDRAAGSTVKDFKRGAQPGRAYLEGGGKPALTMARLGDQAQGVADNAGANLRSAYASSPANIPTQDVYDTLARPISKLRTIQSGPGGTGISPMLDQFRENTMKPVLASGSRGGFTPVQLFDELKKPIAQTTNWRDPSMFDLNKVRQESVGGLGGLLTDAVPEAKPLNRIYQGANNLAGRATSRAATGSSPLTALTRRAAEVGVGTVGGTITGHPWLGLVPLAADSVPGMTTAGYGMFQAGRALPAIPGVLPVLGAGSAAVRPAPKSYERK